MRATRSRIITIATILLVVACAAALTATLRGSGGEPADDGGPHVPGGAQEIDLARTVADYTSRFGPDQGYRHPGRAAREAVATAVGLLLDGHREQAEEQLSERDFAVRTVVDRVSGRRYAEVADRTDAAVTPRGWGRLYIDLDSRPRWSVQVPHPVADEGSEQLGVRVLRGSPGGVLIIAGAHRESGRGNSADVAHRRDTVFHAICAELVRRGLPGIQLHGFAASSAPGYDVIASTGAGTAGRPDGIRLADALRERDLRVCRAWASSCPLEGHDNVQGREAAGKQVAFLHVEFARPVRTSDRHADAAARAIGTVTARWAKGR